MPFLPSMPFFIGNDICRLSRIRSILAGKQGPRFVRRILRLNEIKQTTTLNVLRCILQPPKQRPKPHKSSATAECSSDNELPGFERAVEFMSGRFAAKEAVIKAHPYRRLTFQAISIVRPLYDGTSSDERRRGGALMAVVEADEIHEESRPSVSISHDGEYATAVCLAVNPESTLMVSPTRADKPGTDN